MNIVKIPIPSIILKGDYQGLVYAISGNGNVFEEIGKIPVKEPFKFYKVTEVFSNSEFTTWLVEFRIKKKEKVLK